MSINKELKETIILLRFPFSLFLLPIFLYGLLLKGNWGPSDMVVLLQAFIILHVLVYPSSNGYNSYYDRDEGSIGGLENPPLPNKYLLLSSQVMDVVAILWAFRLNKVFFFCILTYILVSRAYSHPTTRFKKHPFLSLLSVAIFQGVIITVGISSLYFEEISSLSNLELAFFHILPLFFLCSSYPLTQIYQHAEDSKRGDRTLSLILGINGTFRFANMFMVVSALSFVLFFGVILNKWVTCVLFIVLGVPSIVYFLLWKKKCEKDTIHANFRNTMLMNKLSSLTTSLAFILSHFF